MKTRCVSVDKKQFDVCMEKKLWGSNIRTFADWEAGDYLIFFADKQVSAITRISGEPYYSKEPVWDNGAYPNRIAIEIDLLLEDHLKASVTSLVKEALLNHYGPHYGYVFQNLISVEPPLISIINKEIGRLSSKAQPLGFAPVQVSMGAEEREHTKAQHIIALIGNKVGCDNHIALNDRKKKIGTCSPGDLSIDELPHKGVPPEAYRIISLIDNLWIRKDAPICAFEVETSTSIYSGLLRMADLICTFRTSNIELFIVAPSARKDKVINELMRPAFREIGVDQKCSYISTEDIANLYEQVKNLSSGLNYAIIRNISTGLA